MNHASKRRIYTRVTFRKRYPHELSFSFAGWMCDFTRTKQLGQQCRTRRMKWSSSGILTCHSSSTRTSSCPSSNWLRITRPIARRSILLVSVVVLCRENKKKRNLVLILLLINRFKPRYEIEEESKWFKVNLFSREWPRLFNLRFTLSSRVSIFNMGIESERNK